MARKRKTNENQGTLEPGGEGSPTSPVDAEVADANLASAMKGGDDDPSQVASSLSSLKPADWPSGCASCGAPWDQVSYDAGTDLFSCDQCGCWSNPDENHANQAREPSANAIPDVLASETSTPIRTSAKERTWKGEARLEDLLVPISSIVEHPDNIDKHHVQTIVESLLRFGQVRPVLVDETGTIIAGHHVVKAARRLGWTVIAVSQATFRNEGEAKAYLMADNETARRGWETLPIDGQTSMVEAIYEQTGSLDGTGWTIEQLRDYQALTLHKTEMVPVAEVKDHWRNYREHPKDQLEHLTRSLKEHGFYRNVVVARDGTILAGHGIVEAAREIGLNSIPVTRLDIERDSPEALKILAGDNELTRLGEMDDRALAELLKAAHDDVSGLMGTGYDPQTLASLLLVTRSRNEMADLNQAFEWIGLPEFEEVEKPWKFTVQAETKELRDEFMEKLKESGVLGDKDWYHRTPGTQAISVWYPMRGAYDNLALRFDDDINADQLTVYDVIDDTHEDLPGERFE